LNNSKLEAAPGKAEELLATLTRAQKYAESDAEPGCLQYRISVDPNDKHKVCVFEVYVCHLLFTSYIGAEVYKMQEDEAALAKHVESQVSKDNVSFYAGEPGT